MLFQIVYRRLFDVCYERFEKISDCFLEWRTAIEKSTKKPDCKHLQLRTGRVASRWGVSAKRIGVVCLYRSRLRPTSRCAAGARGAAISV
jgi:hypothetical protein